MSATQTETRADYFFFLDIPTRWKDNDIYGHVNNVVYYSYFDTVIAHYLVHQGELDPHTGPVVGFAVETHCNFYRPLSFPDVLEVGLRVAYIGNSSVRYEIGIFCQPEIEPAATGYFVHVFVDRQSRQSASVPSSIRTALEKLWSSRK